MSPELDQAIHKAWRAHETRDWPGAIDLWQECLRLDAKLVLGYWMAGAILIGQRRLEEAEAMLSAGLALEPDHVLLAVEHARAATLLRRWPEAIRRWNVLAQRAPDQKEVLAGRAEAAMQIQMFRMDASITGDASGIDWDAFIAGTAPSDDTALFMQFESLGDNCEFGLVQRHYGAEPVSLLRWNAIGIDTLTAAIRDGLHGVGEPAQTFLVVGQNDEYFVQDRRYGMGMHTFFKTTTITETPEEFHAKMCQRQAYLARQLIEDLSDPTQIFVFKAVAGAALDSARALHAAMEQHGPNHLLFVTEGDRAHPAGTVQEIAPRLFVGAIDHFVHDGGRWEDIDFAGWRLLCQQVRANVRLTGSRTA